MAEIVISDLHLIDVGKIQNVLDTVQAKTILGGFPYIYIFTINDGGINTVSDTIEGAYNVHDNRFSSIDFSRSIRNWVYA
ncbi:hypothetical protein [Nostoc sp. UHCC 0302]|uniref:hypothetical protein n=1 Tax=Nostoc sp. UHCC 0302 TaxID=3134896 RepID=UPI00311CAF36